MGGAAFRGAARPVSAVSEGALTVWTVYVNPLDHPGKWVLRGFNVAGGGAVPHEHCVVADSLEEVRAAVPPGLVRLPPSEHDEPHIFESWV